VAAVRAWVTLSLSPSPLTNPKSAMLTKGAKAITEELNSDALPVGQLLKSAGFAGLAHSRHQHVPTEMCVYQQTRKSR